MKEFIRTRYEISDTVTILFTDGKTEFNTLHFHGDNTDLEISMSPAMFEELCFVLGCVPS
jgi:hypothetical protein